MWGIGVGAVQAATPLIFWWLDSTIVYALGLAAIAAIYGRIASIVPDVQRLTGTRRSTS